MQESRQLCLLINWSWCFIYSLLTPIPRGFISCGQSLNAFGVPAFVMSSASGSVPLVPFLPWKEGFFSAPPHVQKCPLCIPPAGPGPLGFHGPPLETPQGTATSTTQMGVGKEPAQCQSKGSVYSRQNSGSGSLSPGLKSQA